MADVVPVSFWNMNSFRNIIMVVSGILSGVTPFLGCTIVGSAVDCTNSWLGPPWSGVISALLLGIGVLSKAIGGGGTIGENLFNPSVVVSNTTKPGTVTPTQVASH